MKYETLELSKVKEVRTNAEYYLKRLNDPEIKLVQVRQYVGELYHCWKALEGVSKSYHIRRARNILLKGFKEITVGSRMVDRLMFSGMRMNGSVWQLSQVWGKFLVEMAKYDLLEARDAISTSRNAF